MAVCRHLDVVFHADAAKRQEPLEGSAIELCLVLQESGAQQGWDEIQTGLDRDDESRLQRAGQPQRGVSLRWLALGSRRIRELPARIVYLQTEQVS